MKRFALLLVLAFAAEAAASTVYQLPLWNGKSYVYVRLGATFSLANGVLDVVGPTLPAIPYAPNDVILPAAEMPSLTLKCPMADVYRNGILQTENGIDYTVTGLLVTFASIPQPGDVLKVIYRCSP